jgi:hypothetical protein
MKRFCIQRLWHKLEVETFGLNEENYLADITNYTNTIKMYAIGNNETTTILFYKKGSIQVDTRAMIT